MDHVDGFCLKKARKGNERPRNQMGRKNSSGLLDDLSILDESGSKMNEILEVLRIQGARIGLQINVKKTKSLRLAISEDENVTLDNEMIDLVDSFTYRGSIISKDSGSHEDIKSRITKAQFSQLKKVWKNRKISVQTKIRMLESTVMTVVKYD